MTSSSRSTPVASHRILGIDPGLRTTGFGVLQVNGSQLSYLASGVIKSGDGPLAERLRNIFTGIQEVVEQYQPTVAAVEIVFVNINPQSTLLLGQARGVALVALSTLDLPIFEYTALQLKQAVVGHGKAAKQQVQEMVKRILKLPVAPAADPADALGVAICHHHHASLPTMKDNWQATLSSKLGVKNLRIRAGRIIEG